MKKLILFLPLIFSIVASAQCLKETAYAGKVATLSTEREVIVEHVDDENKDTEVTLKLMGMKDSAQFVLEFDMSYHNTARMNEEMTKKDEDEIVLVYEVYKEGKKKGQPSKSIDLKIKAVLMNMTIPYFGTSTFFHKNIFLVNVSREDLNLMLSNEILSIYLKNNIFKKNGKKKGEWIIDLYNPSQISVNNEKLNKVIECLLTAEN